MKSSLFILLLLATVHPLGAEDQVIPTSFPVSRYTGVWESSPFNREVLVAVAQTITSNFAQNLTLEGVVNDDAVGPVVYVRDNAKNEPLVIRMDGSENHPYKIVSVNLVNNPEETKVTITDGTETGEIGYVVAKLTQPIQAFQAKSPEGKNPAVRDPRVAAPPSAGKLVRPPGERIPGNGNPDAAVETEAPKSVTPALDRIDEAPRKRRVPLPGQ
jgi:hypothetical protein